MTSKIKFVLTLFLLVALGVALSACGKRAAHVDPPDSVEDDKYPFVYPNPATDPAPQGNPQP